MKTRYLIVSLMVASVSLNAKMLYSRRSGVWASTSVWSTVGCGGASCGCMPGSGDSVTICSSYTITFTSGGAVNIGGAGNIKYLTIQAGGELDATGHSLFVNSGGILDLYGILIVQNVAIASGASVTAHTGSTFTVQGNFANASNIKLNGTLNVSGNFENDGPAVISGVGCITVAGNYANSLGLVYGTSGGSSAPPCSGDPLPIQLVSFTATYTEQTNSVLIDWIVATQLNNKEFDIEKTLNGIDYEDISIIPGAGTTPFTHTYSVIDNNPERGTSYYRLKQIDIDGNETIFSPVVVFIGNDPANSLAIYPNPVSSNATLVYNSTNENPFSIIITDMAGRVMSSLTMNSVVSGENNFYMNTSRLTTGIYFIHATAGEKVYTLKFIKE